MFPIIRMYAYISYTLLVLWLSLRSKTTLAGKLDRCNWSELTKCWLILTCTIFDRYHLSYTSAGVVSDHRRIHTPIATQRPLNWVFLHITGVLYPEQIIISVILLWFVLHLYTGPTHQPVEEVAHYVVPIQSKNFTFLHPAHTQRHKVYHNIV